MFATGDAVPDGLAVRALYPGEATGRGVGEKFVEGVAAGVEPGFGVGVASGTGKFEEAVDAAFLLAFKFVEGKERELNGPDLLALELLGEP